jgi:hypothetical protein
MVTGTSECVTGQVIRTEPRRFSTTCQARVGEKKL